MRGWKPYLEKKEPTGFLFNDHEIGPASTSTNTEQERRRAARAVAASAKDADDCSTILDMLGLTTDDGL